MQLENSKEMVVSTYHDNHQDSQRELWLAAQCHSMKRHTPACKNSLVSEHMSRMVAGTGGVNFYEYSNCHNVLTYFMNGRGKECTLAKCLRHNI